MTESEQEAKSNSYLPALPYVLPFVLYLVGTTVASSLPGVYPQAYAVVVALVGGATCWLLRPRPFVPRRSGTISAVFVGLLGIGLWIALSWLHLEERLTEWLPRWMRPGARLGFNPFEQLASPLAAYAFIVVRLVGLAVLVPVIEELFWRGFLLRWLVSEDWEQVPIGTFTPISFTIVTLAFTLAHPEWFAAAIYCALLNGLLYWKRDLWFCIVAHSVSNAVLAFYILATGEWWLW